MKIRKTTYEKEKLWLIQPSKLYDKLLNIYTTQRKKLSEDQKKKTINVVNSPENVTLNFTEDKKPGKTLKKKKMKEQD